MNHEAHFIIKMLSFWRNIKILCDINAFLILILFSGFVIEVFKKLFFWSFELFDVVLVTEF